MAEERLKAKEDWQKEAEQYYTEREQKAEMERLQKEAQRERDMEDAARRFQREWTKFTARKELRQRCYARYEKRFDAQYAQPYYHDKGTGQRQWRKPFALGSYDIKVENLWVVMYDSANLPYYYNPSTLDMQWKQPYGTIVCDVCKVDFCVRRCNKLMKFLCMSCYEKQHADASEYDREDLRWKEINGAKETAHEVRCAFCPLICSRKREFTAEVAYQVKVEKLADMPMRTKEGRSRTPADKTSKIKKAVGKLNVMKALNAGAVKQQAASTAAILSSIG